MKRYFCFILILLLALSCERIIDYPVDENGRIYVDAVVGTEGADRINLVVSRPAFGSEAVSAEDIRLSLTNEGKPVELVRDMDYESAIEGEISYLVHGDFLPGQKLELKAEAEGLPSVKALTSVPAAMPEVEVTCREVKSYRDDDEYSGSSSLRTLWEIHLTMDEKPDKDSFFGVQVLKDVSYDTLGKVPEYTWDDFKNAGKTEFDALHVNTKSGEGGSISSVEKELNVIFGGGDMRVFAAEADGEGLALDVYVYPTSSHRKAGSYHFNEAGEEIWEWEIQEIYKYNIIVYRISPEMYHCFRARYMIDAADVPIHLGFTPATYTYTNIEGGLGMFGAVSTYESGWIRFN